MSHNTVYEVEDQETYLPGTKLIDEKRKAALEYFQKLGIPGRKSEDYKYSPVEKIFSVDIEFELPEDISSVKSIDPYRVPGLEAQVCVIVNGKFSKTLSEIKPEKGLTISSLRDAFGKGEKALDDYFDKAADTGNEAFSALNTTFAEDGLFIRLEPGHTSALPIHIISIVTDPRNCLLQPRHFIHCGEGSVLEVFGSSHASGHEFLMNSLTEVFVSPGARVHFYRLQEEGDAGHHICNTYALVDKNGHFDTNTLTLGCSWIRNNLRIALNAPGCESHLNGLFLTVGEQHVDNNTLVDHRYRDCQSNQLYKGILSGRSTGVFNGKIFVRKDAQKTNAYQSSRNILLSENATINAKPQLEIYADDVKCSHGSSTGRIDEDALFYLRSRGLREESARKLLLQAFASDVLETIRSETVREFLRAKIESKLDSIM